MATMEVSVVSAEQELFQGEANAVFARSLEGEIGILPGHQPALLALDIAPVKIDLADGGRELVAVHHGFLYFRENRLVVLADEAELAGQIDVAAAEEERRRFEQEVGGEDDEEARTGLRRAETRLQVAEAIQQRS